jgi:hypothetical protein
MAVNFRDWVTHRLGEASSEPARLPGAPQPPPVIDLRSQPEDVQRALVRLDLDLDLCDQAMSRLEGLVTQLRAASSEGGAVDARGALTGALTAPPAPATVKKATVKKVPAKRTAEKGSASKA